MALDWVTDIFIDFLRAPRIVDITFFDTNYIIGVFGQSLSWGVITNIIAVISLGMRPANERRRYNVTTPLNGLAHTQNDWSL